MLDNLKNQHFFMELPVQILHSHKKWLNLLFGGLGVGHLNLIVNLAK
jgi:hypothetical protein